MLIYFSLPDFLHLSMKQPELFPTTVSGAWPVPFPARDEQTTKSFRLRNMFLRFFERKSRNPHEHRAAGR